MRQTLSLFQSVLVFSLVLPLVSCGSIPVPGMNSDASGIRPEKKAEIPIAQTRITASTSAMVKVTDEGQPKDPAHQTRPGGLADATQSLKTGRYDHAVSLLEVIAREYPDRHYRDMLKDAYIQLYRQHISGRNFTDADALLERGLAFLPDDAELKQLQAQLTVRLKTKKLYQRGLHALQQGSTDRAIALLRQILTLDPGHKPAHDEINKLKARHLDDYYRQAMLYYRGRELDKAIGAWDKVLSLDPAHEKARLYRDRTLTLKQKLEKL